MREVFGCWGSMAKWLPKATTNNSLEGRDIKEMVKSVKPMQIIVDS